MSDYSNERIQHTYLLGAGFSAPLGGPLFNDLLSIKLLRFYDHVMGNCPHEVSEQSWDFVRNIPIYIHQALRRVVSREGNKSGEEAVHVNAEQILELMEAITQGRSNWLCNILQSEIKNLGGLECLASERAKLALRLLKTRVAIEVIQFLQDVPLSSERWLPYQRWFDSLNEDDTVITTNYDPVFEKLAEVSDPTIDVSRLFIDGQIRSKNNPNGHGFPKLLKVHGSYDWRVNGRKIEHKPFQSIEDLFCGEIAIGTPGIAKSGLLQNQLAQIWQIAKRGLKNAHVVSIVGYSLPETDNFARLGVLDSLSENVQLKAVNLVLGKRCERGIRAKSIVEQVVRRNGSVKVKLLPIYAQDYLHAYRPKSFRGIEELSFLE